MTREILDALLAEADAMHGNTVAARKAYEDGTGSLDAWNDALCQQRGMSRAIRIVTETVSA